MKVKNIFFILTLSFFLKASLLVWACFIGGKGEAPYLYPDSEKYKTLSQTLEETHSFGPPENPEIFRTPAYPVFIYFAHKLNKSLSSLLLFQIICSLLTTFLLYSIGLRFFSKKIALCSALIHGIDPLTTLFSLKIMSETLFTLFFVLFLGFTLEAFIDPKKTSWAAVVLSAAACAYVRPIAVYLILIPSATLALNILLKNQTQWKSSLLKIFLISFSFCLLLLPWQLRNWKQSHFFGMSTVKAHNLYFYKAAAVKAAVTGTDYAAMQKKMQRNMRTNDSHRLNKPYLKTKTPGEITSMLFESGKQILFRYPWVYAKIHFSGTLRLFLDPGSVDFLKFFGTYKEGGGLLKKMVSKGLFTTLKDLKHDNPLLFFLTLAFAPYSLLLLFFVGTASFHPQTHTKAGAVLFMTLFYWTLLMGGPESSGRFRVPLVPIMALLASIPLTQKSKDK